MYETLFKKVIKATDGEYLVYNKEPIEAYIHLVSNGYTETNSNIPYLKQTESLWDLAYPNYMNQKILFSRRIKKKTKYQDKNINIEIKQLSLVIEF